MPHATSCHITQPNRTCDWLPSSVGRGRPAILRRGNDGDEREFDGVRHRSRSHYRDRKTGDCAPARGEGRPIAFERDGKPPTVFSRDGGAVDPVPSRRGRRRSCSLAGGRAPIAFPPASDRTDMMHNRGEQWGTKSHRRLGARGGRGGQTCTEGSSSWHPPLGPEM